MFFLPATPKATLREGWLSLPLRDPFIPTGKEKEKTVFPPVLRKARRDESK